MKKEEIKYSGKDLLVAFLVDRARPAVRIDCVGLDLSRTIRESPSAMRILGLLVEIVKLFSPLRDNYCLFLMVR